MLSWLTVALAIGLSGSTGAQNVPDALDQYRSRELQLRLPTWTWSPELYQGGVLVEDFDDAFYGSPKAAGGLEAYQSMSTWGHIALIVGVGTLVAGGIWYGRDAGTGPFVLMLGGLVLEFTGTSLLATARERLNEAVDLYNEDLYERIRKREARSRGLGFGVRGSF